MEHSLPEQIEARSPIHRPFDELQASDVTLELRVAPDQRQPCSYGRFMREQSCGKPGEVVNPTCLRFLDPGIEPLSLPLPHHPGERLAK